MNILFTGVGRRIELLQAFRSAALVLNKPLKLYPPFLFYGETGIRGGLEAAIVVSGEW